MQRESEREAHTLAYDEHVSDDPLRDDRILLHQLRQVVQASGWRREAHPTFDPTWIERGRS